MSKISYSPLQEPIWHPATAFFSRRAPAQFQNWLTDRDSLTQQLISHCQGQFCVKVLRQYWQRPFSSEYHQLGLKHGNTAFIREVHLYCDQQPWVFARTVIPTETLRGELQKLTQLGAQPLGAVLFSNHSIKRAPLEIARFNSKSAMYNEAHINSAHHQDIWGRRSLFYLGNKPLLVNELFLGNIPQKD